MALRPDRRTIDSDIRHFMNTTAERGGIVCWSVSGSVNPSGAANDQAENVVAYVATPSGKKPVGVLMNDVVNLDLTRQHQNFHKDEIQLGGKVTIYPKCTIVTDYVYPGQTPLPGETAYVGHSGYFSNRKIQADDSGTHIVGRFETRKDEDGFATISVNLP
jgi:hypothetical protein